MNKLPFLISIPHGGTVIPKELKSRIRLSSQELLADGDPYTKEIYDMCSDVEVQLKFDIARALIDVNRAENDLPPKNPDGVTKTVSIFNTPIYQQGREPNLKETNSLISRYYEPYHAAIQENLNNPKILFAFDCHSMEAIGPAVSRDSGKKRPLFCLGNNNGKTCAEKTTLLFAECICETFSVPTTEVTINKPFSGGYITQKYGMNPIPWIQIEINRSLYLSEHWNLNDQHLTGEGVIKNLNSRFRKSFILFANKLGIKLL